MKKLIRKSAWTCLFALSMNTAAAAPLVNFGSPLGINTNEALENNTSLPFVNLFKLSMPFDEARPWFTKGHVQYDQNGWPKLLNGGQAGTRFLNQIDPQALPKGVYTVKYDGQGRIRYGGSVKVVSRGQGVDLITMTPMSDKKITATLTIDSSNPRNYVRNIRILLPGGICADNPLRSVSTARQCRGNYQSFADNYNHITFNPDYLNFMKDFKVLRFMNMAGITRNNLSQWTKRPNLNQSTWGGKEGRRGVPLEIMVKLSNKLNIDPWFSIPHNANNDFIKRYALYVRSNLKPHLKAYVEYSNETWNDVFVPQAEHMKQTGTRYKLDTDRRVAGAKYYSLQSTRIFKMWEQMFGGKERLVRVMGGLTSDMNLSHTILGYRDAYKNVDALAVAPYFYVSQERMKSIRSVGQVFQQLEAKDNRYSIANTLKNVGQQAEIAKSYGVDLIAYEGGQHFVQSKTHSVTEGATPYLIQANRHPHMATLYTRLLQGWKKAGGKLFVAFSAPRPYTWHGSWGIKEYINQPMHKAPKYRALIGFAKGHKCWWAACNSTSIKRLPKPINVAQKIYSGDSPDFEKPLSVKIRKQGHARNGIQLAAQNNMRRVINGTIHGGRDLAGSWRSSWDDKNLYVKVNIVDDRLVKDSAKPWADDSIEIYIDADGSRKSRYDGWNDFQLTYRMDDQKLTVGGRTPPHKIYAIQHKMIKVANGYQLETTIPWTTLNVKPKHGHRVGFDIQVNDDDSGDQRDAKLAWNAKTDQAWKNPRMFGELVLSN
ncbi:CBM9 family sugar-binding protein [Leucothrix arctica]|nr:CBM9 family sugar-binding protein [Leucothrix arctica]